MYLSGRNESGANKHNENEKAFVKTICLVPDKDYVGGATCWSSNFIYPKVSYYKYGILIRPLGIFHKYNVTSNECIAVNGYILERSEYIKE